MITEHTLRALPKVELHRHLDGSVRLATMLAIARRHGLDLGSRTPAGLDFNVTTPRCSSRHLDDPNSLAAFQRSQ